MEQNEQTRLVLTVAKRRVEMHIDDMSRVSRYFSTLLRISEATVSFRHPATRISAPSIGPVVNPNGILASIPEGSWCICASSWHRSPESCLEHRPVECL